MDERRLSNVKIRKTKRQQYMCSLRWNDSVLNNNNIIPEDCNDHVNYTDFLEEAYKYLTSDMSFPERVLDMIMDIVRQGNAAEQEALFSSQIISLLLHRLSFKNDVMLNKIVDVLCGVSWALPKYWIKYLPYFGIPQLFQYMYQSDNINNDEGTLSIIDIFKDIVGSADNDKTAILSMIISHLNNILQMAEEPSVLGRILELYIAFVTEVNQTNAQNVQIFFESGVMSLFIQILDHGSKDVVMILLELWSKITAFKIYNGYILESDILYYMNLFIDEEDTLQIVVNLSEGEPGHVMTIIKSNILTTIINTFNGNYFKMSKLAAQILLNTLKVAPTEYLINIARKSPIISVLCNGFIICDPEMTFVNI